MGGRWSGEAWRFVRLLACARAESEPPLLACAAARGLADSLLELPGGCGVAGDVSPLACVLEDARYAVLASPVELPSLH